MAEASQAQPPEVESEVDPAVSTILRCLAPEEIDMLRDAFIYMDRSSDGYVSMEEMLRQVELSVPRERYMPLREYLTPLFLVADKDGDGRLSLTEFLMSFADGPGVVPADVVNSCVAAVRVRLTDEEISALQENFRAMDADGDGYLDAMELEAALRRHLEPRFPDLTEAQYREIIAVILSSADADGDGKLCLSEFIRSFQEDQGVLPASFVDPVFAESPPPTRELSEAEADVLRDAFAVLDKNDDGYIDFVDLYNALWESLSGHGADTAQIRDLCHLIMTTADRRHTGRLSLSEFMLGFLRNMEVMRIPVAVAQEKTRGACERLQTMYESGELERLVTVFEGLDRNGDGYIDRDEMVGVLTSLFKDAFPEWDEETLLSVMAAIVTGAETHTSGRISLEEFIRSFVDGPGVLPPEAVRALDSRANTTSSSSAAAAVMPPARLRPNSASDDDLQRISDALRRLNEAADAEGCVTEGSLRLAIQEAFADQRATHPGKAEAMYRYVLSRFVNVLDDGQLAWNENVQIEEDDRGEDGMDAAADAHVSDVSVRVPVYEQQEPEQPGPVECNAGTTRVASETEEGAVMEEQHAAEEAGEAEEAVDAEQQVRHDCRAARKVKGQSEEKHEERLASPSFGHRRRVVRAASIEFDEVKKGTGARCEDGDCGVTDAAEAGDGDGLRTADGLSTIPAVREGATVTVATTSSTLLDTRKSSVINGATTKRSDVMDSYRYGVLAASSVAADSMFEKELRALFKLYDTGRLGYLDRTQFKKVYSSMEHYGLEPSQAEIDRQFTKYARGSDKIFFDEFCVLMLQRVQM